MNKVTLYNENFGGYLNITSVAPITELDVVSVINHPVNKDAAYEVAHMQVKFSVDLPEDSVESIKAPAKENKVSKAE